MKLDSIDLNVENYSINEIKELFKITDTYTSDDIHEACEKYLKIISDNEDIKIGDKKSIFKFFNSLKVVLIRHLNGNEGMFNNFDNVTELENENKIISEGCGNGGGYEINKRSDLPDLKDNINRNIDNNIKSLTNYNNILDNSNYKGNNTEDTFLINYNDGTQRGNGILNNNNVIQENFNVKYKKDALNPLKFETITKCITIDTRFRDNYSTTMSTDFKCNLTDKLSKVVSMQLSAFEFPTSYLTFSDKMKNNFFCYQILEEGTISKIKTVTIMSGNYSHSELISQINEKIIQNGDNIKFDVDITNMGSGTGKTLIRNNNSQLINIYFDRDENGNYDDTPIPLKFGWTLGFRNNEYSNNKEYVSEGMYEDHGSRYLYLAVNDHNNNSSDTYISVFNQSILNKNILARISMKTPAFHILNETGLHLVTEARKYMGPVNISTLNIQILDEFGRIVDINNMDYSFCLNIECLYN